MYRKQLEEQESNNLLQHRWWRERSPRACFIGFTCFRLACFLYVRFRLGRTGTVRDGSLVKRVPKG